MFERASERTSEQRIPNPYSEKERGAREVGVEVRPPAGRVRVTERKKKEKQTENPHPSPERLVRDFFVLSVRTEHPWKPAVRF